MFRKLLHLQHHRHTGKLLHHRHTSYRTLGVLIIVASSFLLFVALFEQKTKADLLQVSAKVSGAIPTIPAVITEPAPGTQVNTTTITVKGTCEYLDEITIISLYDNGNLVGSTLCTPEGTFSITISVSVGGHQLLVRTNNITDDYGPDSEPVVITYVLPQNTPSQSNGAPNIAPQISQQNQASIGKRPLNIKSKDPYLLFGPSKSAIWEGFVEGGSSPYTILIDWGDGSEDKYENINELQSIISRHQYQEMKSFYVTVKVKDRDNSTIERTYVAVTPYIPVSIVGATTYTYIDPQPYYTSILAYIVLTAIIFVLWFDAKVYMLTIGLQPHSLRIGGRVGKHHHV